MFRIGQGFDVHQLVKIDRLLLEESRFLLKRD